METSFTFPKKNLHGSNIASLQDSYIRAAEAVRRAHTEAMKIDFHARDYGSMTDFLNAKEERMKVLDQLVELQNYFDSIAESLNF
jgi:hypothetical protein